MPINDQQSTSSSRLRRRAEELLKQRTNIKSELTADVLELVQELEVYQVELEIQNEELRRAQQEIAALQLEYEDLYEFAPCGYITLNSKGTISRCNLTAVTLLGTDRTRLKGIAFINVVAPESCDVFWASLKRAGRDGAKQSVDLKLIGKDNAPVYVLADIQADQTESGEVCQWRLVLMDIADRKRAGEERERLQAQLNQAQKLEAVGRLAGGVAHDFNNMLGIILGHADLVLDQIEPDAPYAYDIKEIRKAARRSADLTRQMLAFARKQTICPSIIDLNETVSSILKMLRRLIGEDISLFWKPGMDPWPVKMDPFQIDQILANLAVNSRDAMTGGGGSMTIETANVEFDDSYCQAHKGFTTGSFVMLSISDTGAGMDSETLELIFDPFFTTKEVGKGTGLGLSTVYGIVRQNNGFINVYSEPGHGTTFKIYFPRTKEKVLAKPAVESKKDLKGTETVLFVEDEESMLALGKTILQRHGYEVLAACRPGEALRIALNHPGPIHLLITDVIMPEMNGKDLRDRLAEVRPSFKSIFMSGYTSNVIAHHGILDEGINFLQKPFSVQTLLEKVRRVLDG